MIFLYMNKNLMKPQITQINTDFKNIILSRFSSLSCVNLVKSCGCFYNFLYMNKYINTNGELHECID